MTGLQPSKAPADGDAFAMLMERRNPVGALLATVGPADPLAEPPPRKHRRKRGRRLRVAAASFATELNSPSAPERQPDLRGPIASC